MIVLGLTGVYAGGKSTVAGYFRRLGCEVFDADASAKRVLKKGSKSYRQFVKSFGREYLTAHGEVDRSKLGDFVFSDRMLLKKLMLIIHPQVRSECIRWISSRKKENSIAVLEVPLLFEAGFDNLCDYTLAVVAAKRLLIQRASARGVSRMKSENIIRNQWTAEKKVSKVDFVIRNSKDLRYLKLKVREIFNQLQNKRGVQKV